MTEKARYDVYYMMLIRSDGELMAAAAPEQLGAIAQRVEEFDQSLTSAGQNVGSIRLGDAQAGTVIRVRGGRVMSTDGPFAETKEVLGGIWLIEADDDEAAQAIAARQPLAEFGSVELRPLAGVDLRQSVAWFPYDD